jgi:arabinofuranosyltransferase
MTTINAWLCDDAYITFTTVDNLIHGFGLTWNPDERVQAFTNPLWMFVMAAASLIIHDMYWAALVVSLLCSLAAILLFALTIPRSPGMTVIGVVALTVSKSFVDYPTSGLEDPLTFLLLALFVFIWLRRRDSPRALFWLALVAGLATFNRMDAILLYLPALAGAVWTTLADATTRPWPLMPAPAVPSEPAVAGRSSGAPLRRRILAAGCSVLLGFTPFLLWEGFALWYYGSPVPNTAYAKLDTGIPLTDLLTQGVG